MRGLIGWRRLALVAAVATYLLIVLGGVVRITGSGMGCGPDWPLCNGRLIPPMDFATLLEYGHRLVAAGVALLIFGLVGWAWKPGRSPDWRPFRRLAAIAAALLVVQVMLGAITVWLHLPRSSVVLHLGTAMALLAVLAVGCCRAYGRERVGGGAESGGSAGLGGGADAAGGADSAARLAWAGVAFGAAVVLAGALVANLGAAPACQGFPLCNGAWLPADNTLVRIHWTHRMLAYGFAAYALALPWLTARWRPADRVARRAARFVSGLTVFQVVVAAALVLHGLPETLQALHLAVGGALFATLVVHGWLVAHPPAPESARVAVAGSPAGAASPGPDEPPSGREPAAAAGSPA